MGHELASDEGVARKVIVAWITTHMVEDNVCGRACGEVNNESNADESVYTIFVGVGRAAVWGLEALILILWL